MSFGEELKRIRKEMRVTQEDLAQSLGLNRATISKYESGQIIPTVEQVKRIAKALGVPYGPLLFGQDLIDDMERQKKAQRKEELGALVKQYLSNEPESIRARLVDLLLRFDPEDPTEWSILERIVDSFTREYETAGGGEDDGE